MVCVVRQGEGMMRERMSHATEGEQLYAEVGSWVWL